MPYGAKCRCPCGAGIAPVTPVEVLVTAAVSNWGAYGICACLAMLLQQDGALIHDASLEQRLLNAAAAAGLIDGNSGYVEPGADGLPAVVHVAIVRILGEIIK